MSLRRMSYWDAVASTYRHQHWLERAALDRAVALVPWDPDARVLDAGTGDGATLDALDRAGVSTRRVVAVDASPAMLHEARPRPRTTYVEADVTALPFPDASFDVALAGYLLHVLGADARGRAIGELHRVLAPGGWLVTVTPHAGQTPLGAAWRALSRALDGTRAGSLGGLRPLDPSDLLRASGFEPVRGSYVTGGYPSLCVLARRQA